MIGLISPVSVQRDIDKLEMMLKNYKEFEHKLERCSENQRAIIEVALLGLVNSIANTIRDIRRHHKHYD